MKTEEPALEALDTETLSSPVGCLAIRRQGSFGERPWLRIALLLWSRRRQLCAAAILGLTVGLAIGFLVPAKYESTVNIMPPDSHGEEEALRLVLEERASPGLAAMAGSFLGAKSPSSLFVYLLRSRTVQEEILRKFNLRKVYWKRYEQDARDELNQRTDITEDRKSGAISIVVTDHSAERARGMAEEYVTQLNKLVMQVSTSEARRQRIFIEQRLVSVKNDLEEAEQQFSVFASKNTALDIKEQAKATVESEAVLRGQMIAAQSELEGLRQIYSNNNVRVRSAQARLDEIKRALYKLGGGEPPPGTVLTQSDDGYPSMRKLSLLGVEWTDLYRRMKIEETLYELLNQQYEMARIGEAKEVPTVNVIDPPNLPEKKAFPPRLLISASTSLLVVLALAGWTILVPYAEELDPGDVRRVLTFKLRSCLRNVVERASPGTAQSDVFAADDSLSTL
jgi:capsule polysaccharide export protein KpsE/RkpR